METHIRMTPEVKFCIQYLKDNNISTGTAFERCLSNIKTAPKYRLVPLQSDTFFTELATKMRELWPTGKKDGKWDWRDSVSNLESRLEWLWNYRDLKNYSIDDCLLVCRKYLASYQNNTRYMKLLKYFIIKQKEMTGINKGNGRIQYSYESEFANMLENLTDEERIAEQQARAIEQMPEDYGGTLL